MPRMIFVNLPVTDIQRSRAFYAALGFSFNETFSDENTACVTISDTIFVMLLNHKRFADFTALPIADSKASCAHLLALSCDDRAGVDRMTEAALAAGGSEPRAPQDHGFMYSRACADPDGHVWEPYWMDLDAAMKAMGRTS